MSHMIDYTTYTVPATLYFREGLTTSHNVRIIKLGGNLAMAVGTATGYIVASATQQFKVITSSQIFSNIYGYSLTGWQGAQQTSSIAYAVAQTSTNFLDTYIKCPNTSSATNVVLSYIVFGELA